MSFDASVKAGNGGETSKPGSSASSGDTMKRTAAKERIERYYFQLKDGCGREHCENENCASSPKFSHKDLSNNQAGLKAIELFKANAHLCESNPSKMARGSDREEASCSYVTQQNSMPSKPSDDKKPQSEETTEIASSTRPATSTSRSADGNDVDDQLSRTSYAATSSVQDNISADISPDSSQNSATGLAQVLAQLLHRPPSPPVNAKEDAPFLTTKELMDIVQECKDSASWSKLIRTIGSTFNNYHSLVKSFRKEHSVPSTKEDIRAMEVDLDKDTDEQDSCKDSVDAEFNAKDEELSLDLESLRRVYKEMFFVDDTPFQSALINALMFLSRDLALEMKYHKPYEKDPNFLNIFMIVLEIPHIFNPEYIDTATAAFCKIIEHLPLEAQVKMVNIWCKQSTAWLKDMLHGLQQFITVKVITTEWTREYTVNDEPVITGAATLITLLYYASILNGKQDPATLLDAEEALQMEMEADISQLHQGAMGRDKERSQPHRDRLAILLGINALNCREPLIGWEEFINEPLSDAIEMDKDFTHYKSEKSNKFTFMTHSFMLTTAAKQVGLYYDNRIRMMEERRSSFFASFLGGASGAPMPYLKLRIRRDHIVDDALVNLEMAAMDNPGELKKQLYVEFEGEQGIDEGGVSKEFFQLVIEELFNPDIGMFVLNEETQTFWFNNTCFENDGQFTLIGIMLGLAIYNNVILDVQFPGVVYRKLMGKLGTFADLKDSNPTLAKSLQDLLDYEDDDIEDTFAQTFQNSYTDVFGTLLTHELKPGGEHIAVTSENRQEFVDLYADFLLNKSIEKQFKAFYRGFNLVIDESPVKMLFHPQEVELLVCGSQKFDFQALEQTTEYDGGLTENSTVIKHFWEVVHEFDEEQKRKLLQFTTGSDRVPVGGLSKIKLIIAKNGPDSDRLPTAHTCFNVLLLPEYTGKEKLRERLLKAITYAKGFGML